VLHISNGGTWSFVSEELGPPKPPCGDGAVWQTPACFLMQFLFLRHLLTAKDGT